MMQELMEKDPLTIEEALLTGAITVDGIVQRVVTLTPEQFYPENSIWCLYGQLEETDLMVQIFEYPAYSIIATKQRGVLIMNTESDEWPIVEVIDLPQI